MFLIYESFSPSMQLYVYKSTTVGFVRAMQYFENTVIAVATLLEPMIATIIAFAAGVGTLPGPVGIMGNLLVIIGTLGVVHGSNKPMDH
jgi:hypothetical protein